MNKKFIVCKKLDLTKQNRYYIYMNNNKKTSNISGSKDILKKIKNLKVDTIYSYRIFGEPNDKLRVYLSRLADKGVIVKVERGRFYKPTNMVAVKRSAKEITLNKKLFTNDLFWNVRDGFKIKTETLIKSYLKNYTQDDLMGLYSLFGYTRLIEESLKFYKNRRNPDYQKIRDVLTKFEKWRMENDKRN